MKTLVMMVGLPGSGKTTFIKTWMSEITDKCISRDAIRYSILEDNDEYFAKEDVVFEEFVRQIDEALLTTERYVYADATHLSKGSRAKLLNRLKNVEHAYAIYINTPFDLVLQRNAQRKGREFVPESVIKNMAKSLSIPKKDEGFEMILLADKNMNIRISIKEDV